MLVEKNTPLQDCNTFGIVASADTLVRIRSAADVQAFAVSPHYQGRRVLVLGGGSNIVLTWPPIGHGWLQRPACCRPSPELHGTCEGGA